MPSRVTPNETPAHGDQEMLPSAPSTRNDPTFVVNIQEQENVTEQLLKDIDDVYSPLLRMMKLFGIYCGDSSLKRLASSSRNCKKLSVFSSICIYCVVVGSGLWLNTAMRVAFSGIFFGDDMYMFLMFSFYNLFVSLNGTMSLLLVRLTGSKKSRFENFLVGLLSVVKNGNLEKVKAKAKSGLIMFFFSVITFLVVIFSSQLLLGINLGAVKPWNRWFGFRISSVIFQIIGTGAWLLPVIFFCITCLILENCIDVLHKRMSPLHSISVDLTALKLEYHKVCEVVELADKMLAPLLFSFLSVYIPLLCFGLYSLVNLPQEDWLVFLVDNVIWLLVAVIILAVILLFGSKISEKINGFQKVLQTFPVPTADEVKLVMFLLDIQGDAKGLSVGGLVIITRSLSLTIVGVIISYFAVMLSLPK